VPTSQLVIQESIQWKQQFKDKKEKQGKILTKERVGVTWVKEKRKNIYQKIKKREKRNKR
jgi:hypothetical protein